MTFRMKTWQAMRFSISIISLVRFINIDVTDFCCVSDERTYLCIDFVLLGLFDKFVMMYLFVYILKITFDDSGKEAVFGAGVKVILIPVLILFLLAFVIRIGIYL